MKLEDILERVKDMKYFTTRDFNLSRDQRTPNEI